MENDKDMSFSLIIFTLLSFYIFSNTTTFLANAQNTNNLTNIDTFFRTADALFNQKKYEEAIQYYNKILEINASQIDALNHKGLSLWELHKYNEALQYFDQILKINSSNVKVLNNKGLALSGLEKYDEAIQYFDLALAINASDVILLPYMVSSGSGVMFDALAHGLPFIATDLQFFNEFAMKGLGITVKRDPGEFAKAFKEMENNYHFYSKAVNKFRLNLKWETIANQHNELYLDILKRVHSTKKYMQSSSTTTIEYSNKKSKMMNK